VAARGLAGIVALAAPRTLGGVAHLRRTFDPPREGLAPWEVEVALAWHEGGDVRFPSEPRFRSFVNFGATRGGGKHVAGLRDGLRRFLGWNSHALDREDRLVAAVSI